MQIKAYQQQQALSESHHDNSALAPSDKTASLADPSAQKATIERQQAGKISDLFSHLRNNPQVQHYVKRMMAAIDSGNFDTQSFSHQAPVIMQQTANRLGIDLPTQLAQFGKQLQHAGQSLPPTNPILRHFQHETEQPQLLRQLAGINVNA
ncbi:hypothetical protein [Celerinatantimonas yamalensis]|uniref:Uncharacterized protein n=1 Tax=Celerinatantimonas yamalensis TaxID=559956 RepID=A0ABW9G7Z3_9GAMM